MHGQPKTRSAATLDLPPPFSLVTLREIGDAFAHAQAIAPDEGAGTLVHVGRFDLSEFAVVLEPDEPLVSARRAFYVCMVALYDALVVHAPPERPIEIRWPDAILVDGGLVGGGRLAWPVGTAGTDCPRSDGANPARSRTIMAENFTVFSLRAFIDSHQRLQHF